MKDENFRKYVYISLAGAVGVILCILFFFILLRADQVIMYLGILKNILMPFVYGAVIAYVLTPMCNWLECHTKAILSGHVKESTSDSIAKGVGIFVSIAFGIYMVYLLISMVLPQVITSIGGIIEVLPGNVAKWIGWIEQRLADNEILSTYVEQIVQTVLKNMENWMETKLLPNIQTILNGVSAGLVGVVVTLKNILIGIIAAIYMMSNRRKFAAQAKKLTYSIFPVPVANSILDEVQYINQIFGGFINGKLLDSLIIGIICFVVLNLLNMPYTMLISVIVGVTNIIPFFGPFFGAVPSALIVLTVSPIQCLYFLIFILVLQQFDGNILGPKILGNTTGISSFWVLFSILLFGGLLGFVGMIIGVPTFAVIYDLVKKISNLLLKKKKLSTDTGIYQELVTIQTEGESYRYIQNEERETMEEDGAVQEKEEKNRLDKD